MIPSIEALEAVHRFPAPYLFKAIGENPEKFEAAVRETLSALFPEAPMRVTTRTTDAGRHCSVSAEVLVGTAQDVRTAYERLLTIPGLRLLL